MKHGLMKVALSLAALLTVGLGEATAQDGMGAGKWDKEVVELFGSLPVQDGGRVKPLSTLAGFKLLKLNGKRKLKTPSGETIDPTTWLLDCLFFPEATEEYECFRVQNDEVLVAIGLEVEGKRKRDYYSAAHIREKANELMAKAREWSHIKQQEMEPVQRQLVSLASNFREYLNLTHEFDFAGVEFDAGESERVKAMFGEQTVSLGVALKNMTALRDMVLELRSKSVKDGPDLEAAMAIFTTMEQLHGAARLALLPPEVPVDKQTEWRSATDVFHFVYSEEEPTDENIKLVDLLQKLAQRRADPAMFSSTLTELHAGAASLADTRDEYYKIPIEQKFYRMDFFYRALVLFLFGFVFAAIGWLKPSSIWLQRGVWACVLGGTVVASVGITMRCIIRGRPPVSTLYETILFIAVVCVLIGLVIEYINRQRLALVMSAVFGALGMWISMKYELKEAATAGDTMPSLVAVLDTNFWLSTHVTTVTMGYSAGLLAALIAHVWVFGQLFGLKRGDTAFYKHIVRMVYGVLCFGLLFSVVGTILGGIWANYSWGRFWGWDAKENGALLICLWELMILHARMGGYIRDRGLCNLAIIGGCVVSFSWWGVNLLGVGLHSYGFTSGIAVALYGFMSVEALILLVSGVHHLTERNASATSAATE